MQALAARVETGPQVLIHGDAHAGNIYRTAQGPGLIDWQLLQRGCWALDVSYHIGAVLPIEVAEKEERALLAHYLDTVRRLGGRDARLLRAPFSAIYYAWAPKSEADSWLAKAVPAPTVEQRGAMFEAMAFAREHGYCFYVPNPRVPASRNAPGSAFTSEHTEFPVSLPSVLEPDQDYQLSSVVAPVFDESHHVVFVLGLMGFVDRIRGTRVEKTGKRLREACDRITQFIAGNPPRRAATK